MVDGFPVIVPVNYRVFEGEEGIGLIVKTRPGSVVDRALEAALEIDAVDPLHRQGWSVLVRGLPGHLSAPRSGAWGATSTRTPGSATKTRG